MDDDAPREDAVVKEHLCEAASTDEPPSNQDGTSAGDDQATASELDAASAPPSRSSSPPPSALSMSELVSIRSALRERLERDVLKDRGSALTGDDECVALLEAMFERTVESGQNQSGLLIGSTGSGQKHIVIRALRRLRERFGEFTPVYLNGTILQNEIEAFKEMLAQLTRTQAVKHPVLSYPTMYKYLRDLLAEKAKAGDVVLVILDGLEHFALKSTEKQLLLYNLLDWLQLDDVKMGVLGITADYCIMDSLEKRVRSRFSKLQIVLPVQTFDQVKAMFVSAFTLRTINWAEASHLQRPSPEFVDVFDQHVVELLRDGATRDSAKRLQSILEGLWERGRSSEYFIRLAVSALMYLSVERPFLSPFHFQRAFMLLEPDYQLATLRTINDNGIALLIGMSHLEREGHTFFTLEMVYRKWEAFYRKHDMLRQMPTRAETQFELENLIDLQLVADAGDPFRISNVKFAPSQTLQPEFRAVHLCFEPKTLQGMIRNGSIQCSTAMTQWMLSTS
ncbi:hypothetical protein P43SY_004284 [Pythium insidiosum]|uniref:Origin recognition complex subunit 4 C-terminal domain-containing protein n=1 Tax=Pythium insidiosum TaxID=114742 RepID=A0AAD5LCU3_PYTIN|nr:hypothetical protein P43SY_004284 [Pythium insidiosum]